MSTLMFSFLTLIQLALAVYTTFILYRVSPNIELQKQLKNQSILTITRHQVCEYEKLDTIEQRRSNDSLTTKVKRELYEEILEFQTQSLGAETLAELLAMESKWDLKGHNIPKITIILNHFKRKTLCSQLNSLLHQSLPFHQLWVLSFGSSNEASYKRIVESYNDSRISFVSSDYNFKFYGRFQLALQTEADFVYVLDDDMIPGRKMLEILSHVGGTEKYKNSVLGSIGRILPFMESESGYFPRYTQLGSKEAGIYLPDIAYGVFVEKIVQVDFLSSSWFLPSHLIKSLFLETPLTYATGEDLHLSYQLQKYKNAHSFVLPTDTNNQETWGDCDHRLAHIYESTFIFKDIVEVRDEQWWKALSSGYVTQWAMMNPQNIDALFFAHSINEVEVLAPLLQKFRSSNKTAYLVISGGRFCQCEDAANALQWNVSLCKERRFNILDIGVEALMGISDSNVALHHAVYSGMRGLMKMHNPTLVVALSDINSNIKNALEMAVNGSTSSSTLILLPPSSASKVLWLGDLKSSVLSKWKRMKVSISIITQNRPKSLMRLLNSLSKAYYIGDEISITFNIDSQVDEETLRIANDFEWPHGPKILRRRIIQGKLIRAVVESWYPSTDDDFGLLLEDDIEVSPYYYLWIKYTLLAYHYDPQVSLPQLSSISLYTPRLIEVVEKRPQWNATSFFKNIHPNTPYLQQLPCSWGVVFFPKHWREFYWYMNARFTKYPTLNYVQIPGSVSNSWRDSWKRFLIDMMYLRGYVTLYPNFPNQTSFSTNHMEPGVHIGAKDNLVTHRKEDYEVPLIDDDFWYLLPNGNLPSASRLPSLNLFNQATSLVGLKLAGAKLGIDVLRCNASEIVTVDHLTGLPESCVQIY